jgi:phosphoribosylformylglycinamidine cyclo-ligase
MTVRALVLRAPGINCDRETAHACRLVGFETDVLHINQLIKAPKRLSTTPYLSFLGDSPMVMTWERALCWQKI